MFRRALPLSISIYWRRRKILGSVSQKWISQNSTTGHFESAGGRIPEKERRPLPHPPCPPPKSVSEVSIQLKIPKKTSVEIKSVFKLGHASSYFRIFYLKNLTRSDEINRVEVKHQSFDSSRVSKLQMKRFQHVSG